jgi:beta-lactamase class A
LLVLVAAIAKLAGPQPLETGTAQTTNPATSPATASRQAYDAPVQAFARDGAPAPSLQPLGKSVKAHVDWHAPLSSVYIEDLTTGDTLHVGETTEYNIKSLMKVPLTMSLYKAHELGRLDMDKPVPLAPKNLDASFGELYKKGAGFKLSMRQASVMALQKSDNTAIRLTNDHLFKVMNKEERAYSKIKLQMRVSKDGETFMSTQSYSAIFRCLYDACYNSRTDSDKILSLLRDSDFHMPGRLLPPGTPVAHKIGTLNAQGFRDCGIVYGPKRPFIFCIMLTSGNDQAQRDIGDIVKLAYDHFER